MPLSQLARCRRLPAHLSPLAVLVATVLVAGALTAPAAAGQSPQMSVEPVYRVPAPALANLVTAPATPVVSLSPDQSLMAVADVPGVPSIADLAEPELRIAGLRINPRNNGPSRARYYDGLTLMSLADGTSTPVIGLPEDPRIGSLSWSPDGAWLAFTLAHENGIELWAAEAASGQARRLTDARVNAAYRGAFAWNPGGRTLVVRMTPSDRGPAPEVPTAPEGPVIRQSVGREAAAPTYQDLLKNPYDEAAFEYHMASQVTLVALDGTSVEIGTPGLITRAEPSPDGSYLLVESLSRPFSYLVPANRFPTRVEVWDRDGNVVRNVANLPLAEEQPAGRDSTSTGPRSIDWRQGADATLVWVEAQDGGDARTEADVRDRVFLHAAPFTGEPTVLVDLELRYGGVQWGEGDLALVSSRWWSRRDSRTWIVRPDSPGEAPQLLWQRSTEDRYNDPGRPLSDDSERGSVLAGMGESLFLLGAGASEEGDRPFLDRLDLGTLETERLWRSEAPYYESVVAMLDDRGTRLLTQRESVDEPPNYYMRDLAAGTLEQLTSFPHPTPELTGIHKELVRYQRADGVELSGTLYLPPGYQDGDGPLPLLMWAYPREYKDADLAGQVSGSPYRFNRISYSGALPMLTQGWAVFDNPALPIIGEGDEEPNDTYVEQLVAGARAAVDEVVRRGVADPDRIAIGGHSYGAFMTANLLAHSDLFRAGIARSGAYNRTLTPFGFQSEQRSFWEAPEVYFEMSPFMHADQLDEPILMIHGEADNNSGTFPLQSLRFYNALQGQGAIARLVMLPFESHGYQARESLLHVLWEQAEFLKRYVEYAPPRGEVSNPMSAERGSR